MDTTARTAHYGPYIVEGKAYNVGNSYYRVRLMDTRDTWILDTWECWHDETDRTPENAFQAACSKAAELQAEYDKEQAHKAEITASVRKLERDTDGMLPSYAWPGGYPVYYLDKGSNVLCAECATKILDNPESYENELPVAYDTYMEGPDMNCDNCGAVIESAYGNPEDEEGE